MIIKIILTSLLFIDLSSSNIQVQSTGTITAQISGVEEPKGMLHFSIHDTEKGFPSSKGAEVKTYSIEAVKGKSCFHDSNSNDKLDTSFLVFQKKK